MSSKTSVSETQRFVIILLDENLPNVFYEIRYPKESCKEVGRLEIDCLDGLK